MNVAINAPQFKVRQKNLITDKNHENLSAQAQKLGERINAVVVDVNQQKAALFVSEGFSFEADTNKLKGSPSVGDELCFEVVKNDKTGVTLKQITNETRKNERQFSVDEMREILKQQGYNFAARQNDEQSNGEKAKTDSALRRIKHKISAVLGNITHNAVKELVASGLSVEKISLDMLSKIARETKTVNDRAEGAAETAGPAAPPEGAREKPRKNETPRPYGENRSESPEAPEVARALKINGLTDSAQNASKLLSVAEKWRQIKEFNDEAIVSLLRAGSKLTLDNIYKAKYSIQSQTQSHKASGADVLRNDIEKFLTREGFAVTDENIEISRFLVDSQIDLTAETFNKTVFLRAIDTFGLNEILNLACENIKNGKRASDIEIFSQKQKAAFASLLDEYEKTMEALPRVTPRGIERLLREGREITLRSVCGMGFPRVLQAEDAPSEAALTAKRRLIEIQFKLTQEAAIRLSNKNININVLPIQEALNTLKNLEKTEYEKRFAVMGVPATEERMNEITELFDKVHALRAVSGATLGDAAVRKIPFTINALGGAARGDLTRGDAAYAASETKVNAKYGDSFSRVADKFGALLEKADIPLSPENLNAAMILSKNDIDVTLENIMRVVNIDAKINAVYDTLHPYIAIDMLKNNLNPANMHLDEILEYIETFNGAYGTGVKEKIAAYIMDLDNANLISDLTRGAMMSVYKMLSMIQRDFSAALGVSIKKGSGVTLGSLFNDAKYYQRTKGKKTDLDYKIDGKTDVRLRKAASDSVLKLLSDNIMGQTERNIAAAEAVLSESENRDRHILNYDRLTMLLKEISKNAGNDALSRLIDENADYENWPLEKVAAFLKGAGAYLDAAAAQKYAQTVNTLSDVSPQTVLWLSENGFPLTLENLLVSAALLKKPRLIPEGLNELIKQNPELADELESSAFSGEYVTESAVASRLDIITGILDGAASYAPNGRFVREADLIKNAAKFQSQIEKRAKNRYFQVPVKLRGKTANLDMYILNGDAFENGETGGVKLYLSLTLPALGNVSFYVSAENGAADVLVCADSENALQALREAAPEIRRHVADAGFTAGNISFSQRRGKNIFMSLTQTPSAAPVSDYEFAV